MGTIPPERSSIYTGTSTHSDRQRKKKKKIKLLSQLHPYGSGTPIDRFCARCAVPMGTRAQADICDNCAGVLGMVYRRRASRIDNMGRQRTIPSSLKQGPLTYVLELQPGGQSRERYTLTKVSHAERNDFLKTVKNSEYQDGLEKYEAQFAACFIQSIFRGYRIRKRYYFFNSAATIIQCMLRQHWARALLVWHRERYHAMVVVQSAVRQRLA